MRCCLKWKLSGCRLDDCSAWVGIAHAPVFFPSHTLATRSSVADRIAPPAGLYASGDCLEGVRCVLRFSPTGGLVDNTIWGG